MSVLSQRAQDILEKKYYQPGEKKPEDIFLRVAKVMAIPDVVYSIIHDISKFDPDVHKDAPTCENLASLFHPYDEIYLRALKRIAVASNIVKIELMHVPGTKDYAEFWEKITHKYFTLMADLDFMPGTPVLLNAGKSGNKGMLSSCFFLTVQDSLDEIFSRVKDVAWISKLGGGVGLDISDLRPEGFPVKGTNGTSSGPVSFLKVFNETGNQISQGGLRKAALMAMMSICHPDIIRFVRAKKEEGELQNFNISVLISDKFMNNLKDNPSEKFCASFNGEFFAIKKETGEPIPNNCDNKDVYTYRDLWDYIVKNAWSNGEPGILFEDRMQVGDAFGGKYGKLLPNPCVPIDTWVFTEDGPRQVADLIEDSFTAIVDGAKFPANAFYTTGNKNVVEVSTTEGFKLALTENHLVKKLLGSRKVRDPNNYSGTLLTENYEDWIPAGELSPGDKIRLHNHKNFEHWKGSGNFSDGYLLGMLVGDGHITKCGLGAIEIWEGNEAKDLMDVVLNCVRSMKKRSDFNGFHHNARCNKYTLKLSAIGNLGKQYNIVHGNKHITAAVEKSSSNFYRGFIGGLFDADGSVQGTQKKGVSIRISQSSLEDLQAVQRMLLRLSIYSKVYKRRDDGIKKLPDSNRELKEYHVKDQFELIISGEDILKFKEKIGFYHTGRSEKLKTALSAYKRKLNRTNFVATVAAVEHVGVVPVYDTTVHTAHVFDGNGFYLHNCGELLLLDGESCNLGAINLSNMYDEKSGSIDYEKLDELVGTAVTFLDNTLDVNFFPLEKIEEVSLRGRKLGLGTMGLHDLMLKMKIRYGSSESIALIDELYWRIKKVAKENSVALAVLRGTPPALKDAGSAQRNSALLTAQPTGTVSIIAGCSSGIEPNFDWEYTRKDTFGVHKIKHFILDELAGEDKPDFFVSALDILPKDHIRVQAAIQKYICSSISKTVNLPNWASVKDVESIYRLAYDSGCKSTTVYREGSRKEEVLCKEGTEPHTEKIPVPQRTHRDRPPVLFGVTYRVPTPGGTAYITINEDDGGVRECFISVSKAGSEIGSHVAAQGRLISNSLQWNVPIYTIINHLKGQKSSPVWADGEMVNSVPDAVAKKLEDYIKNYEGFSEFVDKTRAPVVAEAHTSSAISGELCPDCGENLYMESGCNICKSCGFSRCGG